METYADDTTLYDNKISKKAHSLSEWVSEWVRDKYKWVEWNKLVFFIFQQEVHFVPDMLASNPQLKLAICNTNTAQNTIKPLGLTTDSSLSWLKHKWYNHENAERNQYD